ncbi:hypothetical protein A3D03_02955 [Candidatus Gottesmanbacteria bacterium RIFCSPHIGHO2_02_FULL_40_13]|uniref:PIN domain-containing protein n=1 Tax=Candidatus Gottesmanbacteria bacterium RIFCSPHIGHO2_02_FULL_40_13 TaxID=1798384 RepID=A0A1F6AAG4_9BACT|nr:MAG: hypothetical protein A3D03_02955 [Candidatus Gottesmanbacteria bacterium RIFCSPHIGHO2_02_FULL_40_13]
MKLLVDSDCLVGALKEGDPHQKVATKLLKSHNEKGDTLYVLNIVLQETATVLSHRTGMIAVRLFFQLLPSLDLSIIKLDDELEKSAWDIFLHQTKKGTSFVDCANLAVCDFYKIDGILSFDEYYKDKLVTK